MAAKLRTITVLNLLAGLLVGVCLAGDGKVETLVANGGFETADKANPEKPADWELPDGLGVKWVTMEGHGKVMQLDTAVKETDLVAQWKKKGITDWDIPKPAKGPVGATYGLSYYSKPFKIVNGQAYRVSFDVMCPKGGSGAKLWVRGYGMFRGGMRRRYEKVTTCRMEKGVWKHFSEVFHPTRRTKKVEEMKVMLYAYWPTAKYYFDNIKIEPISQEEYERDK